MYIIRVFCVVVSKAKIIGNTEMYIRSGSDINLTCVVLETPDPPSFIYWYRDRDVINYSGRGGISVVTEKQTRTSRLLISKAQPPDTGNYTCAPSASDSASVTVHVLNGNCILLIINIIINIITVPCCFLWSSPRRVLLTVAQKIFVYSIVNFHGQVGP